MSGTALDFEGDYAESRTGRVENGQIRYVKNELYHISPEEIGLSSAELPEGTHINLYFDENGHVIAGENADERNQIVERRVILLLIVVGVMILFLLLFVLISRRTFGKPWFAWLRS